MSLTKRKLSDGEHIASADPLNHKMQKLEDTQQSSATQNDTSKKPFRFLDIAPELRNSIYSFILEDYPSFLPGNTEGPELQTYCPFICVSKQVSSELKSLLVTETTIEAVAHDFNFDHIISFFDKLSEADFRDYVKNTDSNGRFLEAKLSITEPHLFSLSGCELDRLLVAASGWVRWISKTERGVTLNVVYAWGDDVDQHSYESITTVLKRWEERKREERKRDGKEEH